MAPSEPVPVLVKLRPGAASHAAAGVDLEPLFEDAPLDPRVAGEPGGDFGIAAGSRWYLTELPADQATPWDHAHARLADRLGVAESDVEFAEPDLTHDIYPDPGGERPEGPFAAAPPCTGDPQDGSHGQATGPHNQAWHLDDEFSQLGRARDTVTFTDPRTRIAHLDTGYYHLHETLPLETLHHLEKSFVSGDPSRASASDPDRWALIDNSGHGTGTIGILAGSFRKLVTVVPVPASLAPVPYPELPEIWCDRRILTEELVNTITRECGRMVEGLDGDQEVKHRTLDVFRRWTGFSAQLLKPFPIVSTPAWRVLREFAQRDFRRLLDGGLSEQDVLRLCGDLHVLYGKNSVPVLGVPPGADVAAAAKWVAGILFGNPDAVLHLDYGRHKLQNLSHLPTDELSLALAILERYPFWVIAVTSFAAAPSNDVDRLRELTDTEMYEPPDDARSPKLLRRALIVSDTPTAFHKYATVFQMNPPDPAAWLTWVGSDA